MCNSHLIPADFDNFRFQDLQEEINNSNIKAVCWKNSDLEGKNIHPIENEDIVYIYFHDKKKITNQILIKAKVLESDYNKSDKYYFSDYCKKLKNENKLVKGQYKKAILNEYLECADSNKVKGFYLYDFRIINTKDKKNGNFRQISNGIEVDGIDTTVYVRQKMMCLSDGVEKKDKLLKMLENTSFDKCEDFNNYFKDSLCVLCRDRKDYKSRTFIAANGLYYFEAHHILQQNLLRKECESLKLPNIIKESLGNFVNEDFNIINLCSVHHDELHKGMKENRELLLEKILIKNDYINQAKNYKYKNEKMSEDDIEMLMTYIYNQYDLEYIKGE